MAEVKAKKPFSYQDDESGRPVVVRRGEVFDDSHSAVKGREELFEPTEPVKRGPGRPPKNPK